jgi:hypothetical protein
VPTWEGCWPAFSGMQNGNCVSDRIYLLMVLCMQNMTQARPKPTVAVGACPSHILCALPTTTLGVKHETHCDTKCCDGIRATHAEAVPLASCGHQLRVTLHEDSDLRVYQHKCTDEYVCYL